MKIVSCEYCEFSIKKFRKNACHIPRVNKLSTLASLRSRRKRGGGRGARTREKGDWGLGTKEHLVQRPPFFHFCGRQRPQNSDWLIFDGTSHGNDVI